MHSAADSNHFDVYKLIIENIKDKNPSTFDGTTPFHLAAKHGHFKICELIMDYLEDKNPGKHNGWTPFHFAAKNGHIKICKLIMDCLKNKNPSTNGGSTPFHFAADNGHLKVMVVQIGQKFQTFEIRTNSYSAGQKLCKTANFYLSLFSAYFELCNSLIG